MDPHDGELDDAVARLRAARAAGGAARPTPPVPAPAGDDELVERLRARRSAGHVAAAYSAAHGHPLGPGGAAEADEGFGGRRWALGSRAALVAAAAVLVVGLGAGLVAFWPDGAAVEPLAPLGDPAAAEAAAAGGVETPAAGAAPAPDPARPPEAGAEPAAGDALVVVHVVGQVGRPGVVTLSAGSRVGDALEAAGGPTDRADLAAVNLARPVVDGEQVYVPEPGEEPPPTAGGVAPGASGATGGTAAGDGTAAGHDPVDLNAADASTLQTLPGIGPVLAERIVAWREENGPFASVEELGEVSGIGPAVLDGLRDAARV